MSVTRYNYDDWRTRAKSFSGMGAFRPLNMTVTGHGDPERVPGEDDHGDAAAGPRGSSPARAQLYG